MFSLCTFLIGMVLFVYAASYSDKAANTDTDITTMKNKLVALESQPGTLSRQEKAIALRQLDYSLEEEVRQSNHTITRVVAGFFLLIGAISFCTVMLKAHKKSFHRSGLVKYS